MPKISINIRLKVSSIRDFRDEYVKTYIFNVFDVINNWYQLMSSYWPLIALNANIDSITRLLSNVESSRELLLAHRRCRQLSMAFIEPIVTKDIQTIDSIAFTTHLPFAHNWTQLSLKSFINCFIYNYHIISCFSVDIT